MERDRSGPGQREERVLGGRADQHEQALLDVRKQRVLLRAVEAMDLVEEQDRAAALLAHAGAGPLGDLPHVLHTRGDRRQRLERLLGGARHQARDRGLAGSGRPPEDHRRESVGLDEHAERFARTEQVLLPDDVVERTGAEPRCERCPSLQSLRDRGREQVVGQGAHRTAGRNPTPSTTTAAQLFAHLA